MGRKTKSAAETKDKSAFNNPKVTFLPTVDLVPDTRNPRIHDRAQIGAIAKSIESFGFNAPILVNGDNRIVAGHGRFEAAKLLTLMKVPVIRLEHLGEAQARAYMLADNKLTDRSLWNERELALQLKELSDLALDFEIEATGFELPEIDFLVQSLDPPEIADKTDEFEPAAGPAVSCQGDLWLLGQHRLVCGSALDSSAYDALLKSERVAAIFTDPPYNVKIDGHVCGAGATRHREFAMASGEMDEREFTKFLSKSLELAVSHSQPGALVYTFMDWRHLSEMQAAIRESGCDLINVCVWVKSNGGMGSLYRSRHEFVFVCRNGRSKHINNVQLGKFGRNRTNVWNYPGVNSFKRKGHAKALELHPTVKPIALVADAILDSTKCNDIVLDPYLGSGTTILAAERTGRRGYGVELDPLYVDTAIARWERMTGAQACHSSSKIFADVKAERSRKS